MAEQATYLTAEGKKRLQDELEELKNVKRPEIAARLRHAIEQGDISENADYSSAKEDVGKSIIFLPFHNHPSLFLYEVLHKTALF